MIQAVGSSHGAKLTNGNSIPLGEEGARPAQAGEGTPARLFAACALAGGILLTLLTPPLGNPDEHVHLARGYLLSEGLWIAPAQATWAQATIPTSLVTLYRWMDHTQPPAPPRTFRFSELTQLLRHRVEPAVRVEVGFLDYYPPLAYAPQAILIRLARCFDASPALLVYAGRLGNLIFYSVLGTLALLLTPLRRWSLCLLLLLPMNLAQASSLSADAPTLAFASLFVAFTCRAGFASHAVGRGTWQGLLLSACGLGLTKPGYWVLAFAPFVIPLERFPSRSGRWILLGGVLLSATLPGALWATIVVASGPFSSSPVADPSAQLAFLLTHPLESASALVRTAAQLLPLYVETFVGRLGHLNVALPAWFVAATPIVLLGSALMEPSDPPTLNRRRRIFLASLFGIGAVGIFGVAFLGWNEVGAHLIRGVQGRYFAPLAPLALLAIPALGGRMSPAARLQITTAWVLVGLASAISAICQAFLVS